MTFLNLPAVLHTLKLPHNQSTQPTPKSGAAGFKRYAADISL
jgi:hypothetical protein